MIICPPLTAHVPRCLPLSRYWSCCRLCHALCLFFSGLSHQNRHQSEDIAATDWDTADFRDHATRLLHRHLDSVVTVADQVWAEPRTLEPAAATCEHSTVSLLFSTGILDHLAKQPPAAAVSKRPAYPSSDSDLEDEERQRLQSAAVTSAFVHLHAAVVVPPSTFSFPQNSGDTAAIAEQPRAGGDGPLQDTPKSRRKRKKKRRPEEG